jgi:hypothetical protein
MPACHLRLQRAAILVGIALITSGAAASVPDDDATVNQIVELNKKALVLYANLDMGGAAEQLEQALALCNGAELARHPAAARTHLHLGVVYVSGLKKREEGLAEFKRALAIDPKIKIAKSLVNPEVQAVFADAEAAPILPAAQADASPAPTGPAPARPAAASNSRQEASTIQHPLVTQAIRGAPVVIKVQVPPGLGATKVVLAYQAEDGEVFLAREMAPIRGIAGWFQAEIPPEATQGERAAYYLEAQNADDQPIATHGTPERPHQITLAPEVAVEEPSSQKAVEPPVNPAGTANASPGLWFVLAFGSGGGYHSGAPEMNPVDTSRPPRGIHVAGLGLAALGHLAPEVGFFPRERLVISVQGRLQYVTGAQDVVIGPRTYHPAKLAVAGLAKLTWFPRRTQTSLRPFVTAQIGAGQIRHGITTPASANLTNCGQAPTCQDTVVGGLGLGGLGAGVARMLDRNVAVYAAFNVLVGVPHVMVNGDLNLGIAVLQ